MGMNKRQTTNSGQSIKGQLEQMTPAKALCEYVWNAFDAHATDVTINVIPNGMSGISSIEIMDNGSGVALTELDKTFGKFLDSQKNKIRTVTTRGRKGKGRFSFFKFSDRAQWTCWNEKKEFTVEIVSTHLHEYFVSDLIDSSRNNKGVLVSFSPVSIDVDSFEKEIIPYIQNDISWLLVAEPTLNLVINDKKVQPAEYSSNLYTAEYESFNFEIKTTLWAKKPETEKSYIYFINSLGTVVHKELSEMNRKGFHCSAYVISDWFDFFDIDNILISDDAHGIESEEFKSITSFVKTKLRDEFRIFKSSVADQLIQEYLSDGIFPAYTGDNLAYNEFRRNQLIETIKVIYEAEPLIFSKSMNQKQKKIFIKLLDRIVETNNLANLFDIFEGIISLSDSEVKKLASVIQRTSLSNITKTLSFINDRLDILDYFKTILYEFKKESYEVKHIQKCVEENLWLFGEQYNLLASEEDKFDKALRKYLSTVSGFSEEHFNKHTINHPDKNKEMDIFAALRGKRHADNGSEYFHCVVIELKRPSVKLSDKELQQIKTYKNVINATDEFKDDNTIWDFILVGNEISDSPITSANLRDELESNRSHGEYGLIQKSGNKRIYIKTWKQVLNDFELRYNDLTDRLKLKELEIIKTSPDYLSEKIKELSNND